MGFSDYEKYDALGLAGLVRAKDVTPTELLEEAIARVGRVNPKINAVIRPLFGRAREQAGGPLAEGPFTGVPFLLKDLQAALAGVPLSSGSRFYGDWAPAENSELVSRFLATGLVVAGKTNTPEFGLLPTTEPLAFGPTRNPWDTGRTAGGSSGGTGAAVASRIVPMASGGDGGGSIRIPAACNGVFGLKPTRGRTPTGPFEAEAWHGFAIEHVLSLSVRDSAAMLDATCGPYLGDRDALPRPEGSFLEEVAKPPGQLRIAVGAEPLLPGKLHGDCRAGLEKTVRLLEELGHEVVDAAPSLDSLAFARAFLLMVTAHTWAGLRLAEERTGRRARRSEFEEETWLSGLMGAKFSAGEYVRAAAGLQQMAREVLRFAEGYDLLLNPTLAKPPPKLGFLEPHGAQALLQKLATRLPIVGLFKSGPALDRAAAETFAFIPYTPVYNVTGQPSMSVPLCWSAEGLPVGMMFTAHLGDEATLYRLAAQLEEARPWKDKKPPVCG